MNILIAGGSGYVGRALTALLQTHGHHVSWLSRKKNSSESIQQFVWDYTKGYVDKGTFDKQDVVINLAGASIGARRWTNAYKNELHGSRVLATQFLISQLLKSGSTVQTFIQISATGFYGHQSPHTISYETSDAGKDFLAGLCVQWEQALQPLTNQGVRTLIFRSAVVFNQGSQAYEKMIQSIKLGIGIVFGTGQQYFPWIHVEDLCRMMKWGIENVTLSGIFNAVSPQTIRQEGVNRTMAERLHKQIWMLRMPAWLAKIILGEMSDLLLYGNKISSEKICSTGFEFEKGSL